MSNITNLCDICSKRESCYISCYILEDIQRETDDIAVDYGASFNMIVNFVVIKCPNFKYDQKKIKEVERICFSCKKSKSCSL